MAFEKDYISKLTRVNNDTNGNPRYVIHFLEFLNNSDKVYLDLDSKYKIAKKRALSIGGKTFNNKQFGGGFVFQSYSPEDLWKKVLSSREVTDFIKKKKRK